MWLGLECGQTFLLVGIPEVCTRMVRCPRLNLPGCKEQTQEGLQDLLAAYLREETRKTTIQLNGYFLTRISSF